MAVTYATVSSVGAGPGPRLKYEFYPETTNNTVTIAADDYIHVGPFAAVTDAQGGFSVALPLLTDQGGASLVWRVVETPQTQIPGRGLAARTIGHFTIPASIDYDDLIASAIVPTVVTPDIVTNVGNLAADAQTSADAAAASAASVNREQANGVAGLDGTGKLYETRIPDRLSATSLTDARKGAPFHNVKDYGAIGDGTTNDGAVINAAINAANAAGGGVVLLPWTATGYLTTQQITMKSGVTLRGIGGVTLKRGGTSGTQMISVNASQTDMAFEDLTIDFNGLASSFGILVPDTVSRIRWSRCKFKDTKTVTTGIQMRASDAIIEDCFFDGFNSSIEVNYAPARVSIRRNRIINWKERGIRVLGTATNGAASDLTIEHNRITNVDTTGTVRQAIQFAGDDAAPFLRPKVNFNTVIGPDLDLSVGGTADQISVHRCRDFEVIGNTSINAGDMGITVAQQCARGVVANNVVTGADNAGIAVGSSSSTFTRDISIFGNVLMNNGRDRDATASNSAKAGVRGYGATGLVIGGNVFSDDQGVVTQKYGVSIANCDLVKLGPDLSRNVGLATYFKDGAGNTNITTVTTAAF